MHARSDEPDVAIDINRLYGCWRLLEAIAVAADGTPLPPPYGANPMGQLVLARNGRMMAVLCDGAIDLPEGERRAYSSYCGRFTVDGDVLTTVVDAAADESRIGSLQIRRLRLRDCRLSLRPPPRADGERRELWWGRIGDA